MQYSALKLIPIIGKTLHGLLGTYLNHSDSYDYSTVFYFHPFEKDQHWHLTVETGGSMDKRRISVTLYKDLAGGSMEVGTAPLWNEDGIVQLFEWLDDIEQAGVTMDSPEGEHDKPYFCHACGKRVRGKEHFYKNHSRPRDVAADQTTLDCYLPGGRENPVEL